MSNTNTGGPAFPHEYFDHQLSRTRTMAGMTLRDYFAAKAMQSLLARSTYGIEDDPLDVSSVAYDYADAMMKAREA
jgi:hypothetical protein